MSHNAHNSAHDYNGPRRSRGTRLRSKLGKSITLKRLERLLDPNRPRRSTKEVRPMKDLSISISGSAQVSDELAEKIQAVSDALKAEAPHVHVSVGITDPQAGG